MTEHRAAFKKKEGATPCVPLQCHSDTVHTCLFLHYYSKCIKIHQIILFVFVVMSVMEIWDGLSGHAPQKCVSAAPEHCTYSIRERISIWIGVGKEKWVHRFSPWSIYFLFFHLIHPLSSAYFVINDCLIPACCRRTELELQGQFVCSARWWYERGLWLSNVLSTLFSKNFYKPSAWDTTSGRLVSRVITVCVCVFTPCC